MSNILYNTDGFTITTVNPPARLNHSLKLMIRRTSDYGFKAYIPMNKVGTQAAEAIFDSINLPVRFDSKRQEFIIVGDRARFSFILKYGAYVDK